MFKAFLCGLSLTAVLCGNATVSQARDVDVWGHKFQLGSDAGAAPSAPRFNSFVGERERTDRDRSQDDLGR